MKAVDVEVYWDSGCTDTVTAVNWDILEPGMTFAKVMHVKNTGNAPLTLSMTCERWNPPEAEMHIDLVLDEDGTIVQPGVVVPVHVTLTVSPSISEITDFTFDMIITGTG